jgi:PAS domain S-box-containing protein
MDGMILIDTNYVITFVSPAIKHILGFDVDEVLGKNAFEFIHPKDIPWAAESLQREIENNPVIKSISIRLLKKSGEWLWCMVRGHNLFNNPYVNSVVIYFHDDTLRKTANEKLKVSEERFRHLISELQVGVLMQDNAGEVLLCNKMATQILGIAEEKLIGRKTHDYLHDVIHESGKRFADDEFTFHVAMHTKKPVRNKVMGIWRTSTNDRVWILVNAEPIIGENGEVQHVICSFADITERKMLEQKLIAEEVNHQRLLTQATIDGQEQERKEIGKELHDNIGQQLTTTKLYLDLAKSTADDSTNELISLALKSVSDVINEIRSISHSLVPPSLGDLGLYESLKELTDSIRRTQMIDVQLDFLEVNEHDLPDNKKLMVYRIVQEQLNNIVKHANASEIFVSVFNDEKHFLIEVKDNGNGFDMATVRKGLGLSNIQNRAELFGGRVAVNTAPGKGCLLKVLIPHQLN